MNQRFRPSRRAPLTIALLVIAAGAAPVGSRHRAFAQTAPSLPDAPLGDAGAADGGASNVPVPPTSAPDAGAGDGGASPPPTPVTAAVAPAVEERTESLGVVVVTGRAYTPTTLLPTRPAESVYGTEAKVLDTPRSISQVNAAQLARDPIKSADDLVKYAPGVSRGGGQNASFAPTIRAQASEVFQDGQRGYNVRHPTNLNAYEGADIVAGNSSVIFGPSSASGGYINYITKKPNFNRAQSEVTALFGAWVPGDESYGSGRITIDSTAPLTDALAFRVSVTNQRANDYYENVTNNFEAYYAALAWAPRSDFRLDVNAAYDDYYDFNVTHGWNRITQDLVDSYGKKYAAGRSTPIINSPGVGLWSPVFASGAPTSAVVGWQSRQRNESGQYVAVGPVNNGPLPNATAATAGTIQGWVYDPTIPGNGLAEISPRQFSRAEDKNTARRLIAQARAEWIVSPTWTLVDRQYVQRSSDTTNSVGSFLAQYRDNIIENRLELQGSSQRDFFGLGLSHRSNTGASFRYESFLTKAANNSFNINPYDLTQNPTDKTPGGLLGLPRTTSASGSWIGTAGAPVSTAQLGYLNLPRMYPVENGLYAEIGGSAPNATYSGEGYWRTVTAFTQHNFLLADRFGLNLGASRSYITASLANPVVPTPDQARSDKGAFRLYSLQASPFVKPTANSTVYFTYDRSRALNTGGFGNFITWGANDKLNPLSFRSLAELYEAGVKVDVLPDRLFVSAAGFYQERETAPDTSGNMARITIKGGESAIRYQHDRHFGGGVNLSYVDARYTFIIPAGFSPFGFYADNATVWGDSNRLNQRTGAAYDAAGIPRYTVTGYVNARTDFGLGAELAAWWTSGWYTNLSQTVRVPAEYNLDLTVSYRQPTWDVAVVVTNLTDQKNFVNGLAGPTTEFLQPMRPLSAQAQVGYRF